MSVLLSDQITIVTGLPRSGTSAMMQMLRAGGLPIATDGARTADEDNPRGYFELEAIKRLREGPASFVGELRGRAVKVISVLLNALPRDHRYRVIVMQRRLPEMLLSQRVMLRRREVPIDAPDERVEAALQRELSRLGAWLESRPDIPALRIDYNQLVSTPMSLAAEVNKFLGGSLDVKAMAAAVDPALYRRRIL